VTCCGPARAAGKARERMKSRMETLLETSGRSLKGRFLEGLARSHFVQSAYGACRRIPALGGLLHRAADRLLPHGTRVWTRLPGGLGKGLWFCLNPRFEQGYINGDHEPWVQEVLKARLRRGDCFYDVGAHTGFFSVIAARLVGEKGSVVAMEADPQNAALLRANVARNGMTQVRLIAAAIWSFSGELRFTQASEASNRTEGRVAPEAAAGERTITVPAVTLEDLFFREHERPPQLIKIDVEGGEWEVLQGTQRLLAEAKPALLCEVHDPAMIDKIQEFLRRFGYAVEHSQPVHPRYPDYRQHYVWAIPRQAPGEAR
jgi:FkbM family methyltransferase